MNTTAGRLAALKERKAQLRRELDDIARSKPESVNAALADLEKALMAELDRIEAQIRQIESYLAKCRPPHPSADPNPSP